MIMDPTRLKTLRELALRGTMAAVSEALHLTPSAVSQQIAQLEQEAGVALIERVGRGVRLTAAGLRLVPHVERIMAALEDARSDMEAMSGVISGEIRVMAFPSVAAAVLPLAAARIGAEHPGIRLVCENLEPRPALAALRSWQCDLAFIDDLTLEETPGIDGLHVVPVLRDDLVAVLPADHPIARQEVPLGALAALPWAMDARSDTFSDVILRRCRDAGFQPDIPVRYDSYSVIARFVAAGHAVSVLPRARITMPLMPGIAIRPLAPPVQREIRLAVRKGEIGRPALSAVLATIGEICAGLIRSGAFLPLEGREPSVRPAAR